MRTRSAKRANALRLLKAKRTDLVLDDYTQRNLKLQFARGTRSGLPGRYAPFCAEGVGTSPTPYRNFLTRTGGCCVLAAA
jgi:hypothetical protein